ncbi:MAG: HEPN domain-containing protein [Candidatus Omnitrophica bacterium]|nr:HEPN domain-containing protein [Candidatus Omnitrophota bacterium]
MDKLFRKLEREGRLRRQKAGIIQIETLLKEAILDLEEAKKISNIAERATYILAYMAMLKAGRALLLLKGYVPSDGAQHKTVVEVTSAILGDEYKELTGQFEIMRRRRNEMTYEAGALLTLSDAKHAFKDAISLVREVLKEVKSRNPQLELHFKL